MVIHSEKDLVPLKTRILKMSCSESVQSTEDREGKRKRHKEAESERRKRIKLQMERLSSLIDEEDCDQRSLLATATEILQRQQQQLHRLETLKKTHLTPSGIGHDAILDETEFLHIFMASPIPMAISGLNGQFIDCNLAFQSSLGYTREELSSLSIFLLTPDDQMDAIFQVLSALLKGNIRDISFKKLCRKKDGSTLNFLVSISLVRDPNTLKAKLFTCSIFP